MVLMCGLELTLFAVVMFALTPASTWAAVNGGAAALAAVCVAAASAAVRIASGAASTRAPAATTAKRVRVVDMAGDLRQPLVRLFNRSKHLSLRSRNRI